MPGLEARAVQPVASPYAGYVTLAPLKTLAVKHNGLSPNSLGETEENIEKEVLGLPKNCEMAAEFDTL
jgi:hypothetical protein